MGGVPDEASKRKVSDSIKRLGEKGGNAEKRNQRGGMDGDEETVGKGGGPKAEGPPSRGQSTRRTGDLETETQGPEPGVRDVEGRGGKEVGSGHQSRPGDGKDHGVSDTEKQSREPRERQGSRPKKCSGTGQKG